MKKQKTLGKYEKGVIITGVIVAIILLILITADGIKDIGKNNTPIGLSEQEENATTQPNAPVLSAGMIPVKYEGENIVICKNDSAWYNYSEGKPAYMMLNDGVYQSELIVDMVEKGKKLASENIGQVVPIVEQGSIYMWIPRFAIDTETEEIVYVEQEKMVAGKYNQQATFTYKTENMDFSLAGIWLEKTPLANASAVNTKVTNMNKEDNIYGLIANTVGESAAEGDCPMTTELWTTGTVPDGIANPTNTNRTILKIIDTNKPEPIKARAYYDETEGKIKVEVTYSKNGIATIEDKRGNILSTNSTIADTGEELIGNGTYKFTVTDKLENRKQMILKITNFKIYVIPDLETLKEFRDEVNAGNTFSGITVIQTADIEMNEDKYTIDEETKEITFTEDSEKWIPIGDYSASSKPYFSGTYDGGGHTISGIYVDNENAAYQGLFGMANNISIIKNLNIEKSKVIGSSYTGGIVGQASGTIENSSNSGEVYGTGNGIGGICGYANSRLTISKCYNAGKIKSSSVYVGGVVGYGYIIKDCYNRGEVESESNQLGGIVGVCNGEITNCYNYGNVSLTATSGRYAGGICGYYNKNGGESSNCYNYGKITGNRSIGGIYGYVSNGKLKNMFNCGEIIGNEYVGGICGEGAEIQYSYNTGNISAKNRFAGGIVGSGGHDSKMHCYNTGTIRAESEYAGGIAGYSGNNFSGTITKFNYNVGNISSNSAKFGGILGRSGYQPDMSNNYYLIGTASKGIGETYNNTAISSTATTAMSHSQMQKLVSSLGKENWKNDIGINNGLPILSWQTNNDKLNLINGNNAFVEDTKGINNGYPILRWQAK